MKQEHNTQKSDSFSTPEELFSVSQKTGLTASEQSQMWNELKSYATYHSPVSAPKNTLTARSPFSLLAHWYVGALASLFFVIGTGATANYSLPGDFLYPIKTEVTEPLLGTLRFSDKDQLEYLGHIIDNRLLEMKELSAINSLSELEITILEEKITEHSSEIIEIVGETEKNKDEISAKETVELLSEIVSDLKTQEYLEDTYVSAQRGSQIEVAGEALNQLYKEELTDFSTEEPEAVSTYIEEILTEIDEYVNDPTQPTESGIEVRDYLVDVNEALESNDLEQALYSSSEAQQVIQLDNQIESLEEATSDMQ